MVIVALEFLVAGFPWLVLGRGSQELIGFVVAETKNLENSL
jgi:hypothetical protein